MAGANMGDGLDVLGYFAGFWLFLFSRGFREAWLSEFRTESWLGKVWSLIEAALSFACGVILPATLVFLALRSRGLI